MASTARFDVVAIGNAIVDVIARADDALITAEGLTKGSMRLIDAEEAERLYAAMGPAIEMSGGSAANTLVLVKWEKTAPFSPNSASSSLSERPSVRFFTSTITHIYGLLAVVRSAARCV